MVNYLRSDHLDSPIEPLLKVKSFPSFCHQHLLTMKRAFRHFFFGGGGSVVITFVQCNTQNFADMSNLLDNQEVKNLFLIYTLFGGRGVL